MLRFSIRDVLLVMAIVAILVAWYANRREMKTTEHELRSEVQQLQRENAKLNRQLQPYRLHMLDQGMMLDAAAQRSKIKSRLPAKDE
jgi:hypothetical protein